MVKKNQEARRKGKSRAKIWKENIKESSMVKTIKHKQEQHYKAKRYQDNILNDYALVPKHVQEV